MENVIGDASTPATLNPRDAWVERVLGITARAPQPGAAQAPLPFQIFVRSADGVMLTLTLPDRENTLIGDLLAMLENRTGIGWDQQYLTTGTKPVNVQHAGRPVADYNIQPNQTLSLQGRLKGGFGERAAIAETVLKGISHGNVLGDIHQTQGKSKALKDFSRWLTRWQEEDGSPNVGGQKHLLAIADEAVRRGLAAPQDKAQWLNDNLSFIKAVGTTTVQAGNCGDYTEVVYSELIGKTTGQTVYQVVMTKPYDHQFVVTSPTNHGTDITALAGDVEAMVADAWWGNRICTFTKFVADYNPYSKPVTATNLKIVKVGAATGQPFPKPMADFVAIQTKQAVQTYQSYVDDWANENHLKTTALVDAMDEVERLAGKLATFEKSLLRAKVLAAELDKEQQGISDEIVKLGLSLDAAKEAKAGYERDIDEINGILATMSRNDTPELRKAASEFALKLKVAVDNMNTTEQEIQENSRELADLKQQLQIKNQSWVDLVKAQADYAAAKKDLPGSFGNVRRAWDGGMEDARTPLEVYANVLVSFDHGGADNFKAEVAQLSDGEFKAFWTRSRFADIVKKNVPDLHARAKRLSLM